ncbi:MAG: Hsp20 family protein [Candidatus Acidiferrum sp.]
MGEGTAVKRAEEPTRATRDISLLDQMDETFNALARRAYEIFESNGRSFGSDLENWFQAEKELFHPVPVNVTESEEGFDVKAEVPGFSEKEIEISVEPRRLTITGKRETKKEERKGKTVIAESRSDEMLRIVDLPAEIETNKVRATLKNGVMELILPKVAKAQPLRIHPKAA